MTSTTVPKTIDRVHYQTADVTDDEELAIIQDDYGKLVSASDEGLATYEDVTVFLNVLA